MGQLGVAHRRSPIHPGDAWRRAGAPDSHPTEECDAASKGLLAGLQCAGRPAALLDRDGRLLGSNPLARPFVDLLRSTGLDKPPGASRSVHQRVRDIVEGAQRRGTGAGTAREPADATVLALPDGAMLVVRATALGTDDAGLFRHASVLMQFTRLGFDLAPNPAFLRSAFGLTATEAEVALALVGGASASAIARERSVGLETIRSHLKTIFAKTGTRRQAHLVALVLQLRDLAPPG